MIYRSLIYLILSLVFISCANPQQDHRLVIWITAGLEGEWMSRGGIDGPKTGGLLHISRALERYRRPGDLLVDLGRFHYPKSIQGEQRTWRVKGDGFLKNLARLDYTALNVSLLDLSPWPPDLVSRSRDYNLPLISANIGKDSLLFPPFAEVSCLGGTIVQFLGLGGGENEFADWSSPESASTLFPDDDKFRILLTDASFDGIRTFLQSGAQLNLVLWLNEGEPIFKDIEDVPVLGIGSGGRSIGRLEIRNIQERKIIRSDCDLSGWADGKPFRHHPIRERIVSSWSFWKKSPPLRAYLWAIPISMSPQKAAQIQLLQTSQEIRRLADLEELHRDTETGYAGPERCLDCHLEEHPENLVAHHQPTDPDLIRSYPVFERCMPCHATGFDDPEGFLFPWERSGLIRVGCEACHEPAYDHALEGESPYPTVPQDDLCLNCHLPENRPSNHPD